MPEITPPSAVELAQLDLLVWLIEGGFLTSNGLAEVRSRLLHDRAYGSLQGRKVAVLAMRALALERGWPPADDPMWPPDGDPVWADAALPEVPDHPPDG